MSNKNNTVVNVVVLGVGNIGKGWLAQLTELKAKHGNLVALRLVGICNSSRFAYNEAGLPITNYQHFIDNSKAGSVNDIIASISDSKLSNVVVLDVTASEQLSHHYFELAELGCNIISANKNPLCIPSERYQRLVKLLTTNNCFWGINATVGAALPIQRSISELQQAGDSIKLISGVLSGSLSFLLNQYDGSRSFLSLIKQAQQQGFTEPDPRIDLSGQDVRRKVLILSRLLGFVHTNLEDIKTKPLLPESLLTGSLDDFLQAEQAIESYIYPQHVTADADNGKLVYLAKLQRFGNKLSATVELTSKSKSQAVAQLSGTDNMLSIQSEFYSNTPLTIIGPGAGVEVTVAAVNIDLNNYITHVAMVNNQQAN